ncbi:MAG: hypothetical protein ACKVZJ_16105 [Phycisphaerales bacterium]
MNVSKDTALCRVCNALFRLSDAIEQEAEGPFDSSRPPSGAWYRDEGSRIVVGGTTRNPAGYFLVGFSTIWIVGLGLGLSLVPSNQIDPMFAVLFASMSVIMMGLAFFTGLFFLFGRVEVSISGTTAEVFTGLGQFGRRQAVDWSGVTGVAWTGTNTNVNNNPVRALALEGRERVVFGMALPEGRKKFVRRALLTLLPLPSDAAG